MEAQNVEGGGYICLENIDKSIFIGEETFFTSHISKRVQKVGDINFSEFKSYIDETIQKICDDKEFLPSPKSKSICNFCVAGPVCAKGMEV